MTDREAYHKIFSDETVFRRFHLPTPPHTRDGEIRELRWKIGRPLRGEPPENIFVTGDTGVGKTTVVKYVIDQLSGLEDYVGSTYGIYCTLESKPTSHATAKKIIEKIRGEDVFNSDYKGDGLSYSKVYSDLVNDLKQLDGLTVIVIDHVQELATAEEFFKDFTEQLVSSPQLPVTLITISQSRQPVEELEPTVADRLREKEIHFSAYTQSEIEEILKQTTRKGFREGRVEDDVVPLCAELASESIDSVTKGKQLLAKAGERASEMNADEVSVDHVYQVK